LEDDMPEIILKNVTKKFGSFVAVDHLNMTISDGDFITLLGPSGCGKTTTLRMIAGLETPTEGEILIDGTVVFSSDKQIDISPSKRNIGFLFQNYALWPHMTVWKNISFGLENLKWSKEQIKERVEELLDMLKIREFAARYPAELSGGQQQRVAIARTLATNPQILLMDEPLSNLDAKLRMEMRTELKRLHKETKATFVYVTHDQLEAMTLATKICLLDKGLLQQYQSPLTIYGKPANLFVADFVGSPTMNFIRCEAKSVDKHTLKLSNQVLCLHFSASSDLTGVTGGPVTLGIRPESVTLSEDGKLKTVVYSSLPSGMETILRLQIGDLLLNSVVFGSLDFPVGSELNISFSGQSVVLFDQEGTFVTTGSLALA